MTEFYFRNSPTRHYALPFEAQPLEGGVMKRLITCILTSACACALCVGLAACGSGSPSSSAASSSAASSASVSQAASSAQSASAPKPAAGVDPSAIDPGAPDIWRLNGDASAEGIRFEKADNEAGLAFVRVSASGEDGDGEFNLVITDEKHLRTPLSTAPKIDIVFTDNDTCYDYVTGNWYNRA